MFIAVRCIAATRAAGTAYDVINQSINQSIFHRYCPGTSRPETIFVLVHSVLGQFLLNQKNATIRTENLWIILTVFVPVHHVLGPSLS